MRSRDLERSERAGVQVLGPQEARVVLLARGKGDLLDSGPGAGWPLSRRPLPRRSKRETKGDLWESNERIGSAGGKAPGFQPQK
jgi:hypothetical protein